MKNPNNIIISSYNKYSGSVKLLRKETGWAKLFNGFITGRFYNNPSVSIINWGKVSNSNLLSYFYNNILTFNKDVSVTLNKLSFFKHCQDKTWCPKFTEDSNVAMSWLSNGDRVIARSTLTGCEGEGIIVLRSVSDLTPAIVSSTKVYVKYIPKKSEFRIHVIDGKVVKVQKKVKSSNVDNPSCWEVRSHRHGFIFQTNNITCPQVCLDAAVEAVNHCNLDFGGVDVVYLESKNKAYVLEINSAPGIEGETVKVYAEKLTEMVLSRRHSV